MNIIPYDVIFHILNFNYTYHSNYEIINKDCKKIFSKDKFNKYANKINNWYKVNTFRKEYETESGRGWYNLPKKFIIKYYCKNYPIKYFLEYPEFMARKLHRDDLQEYISNNMSPISERKKIEVVNFLYLPEISIEDISYSGW